MNRFLSIFFTFFMFAVVGLGGFFVLNVLKPKPEQAGERPAGLSVFVERVESDDLQFSVKAQGEVRPRREILVAPQISGRIAYVSPDFIDGGFIRKGQVLIRLEDADYRLGVVRAQAGVASAEQRLAREEAEAEIARQDLASLGVADSSPLARREPQLAEAQASLDSAKAQLADAELALSRTAVIAPFTGRVREKNVDTGQFVSPGMSLGSIFATDVVEVLLPITDEQLGQLGLPLAFAETASTPGPAVTFSGSVGGEVREWSGRVTRTSAAVNPSTRLINVIAQLEDPYGAGADDGAPMAPGLFVTAQIIGTNVDGLLLAPRAALRSGNKIFLCDPDAGELRIHEIDVVFSSPEGAWFNSGDIQVGDLAVISPLQAPFDGMSIIGVERLPDGSTVTYNPALEEESADNGGGEGAADATVASIQGD